MLGTLYLFDKNNKSYISSTTMKIGKETAELEIFIGILVDVPCRMVA